MDIWRLTGGWRQGENKGFLRLSRLQHAVASPALSSHVSGSKTQEMTFNWLSRVKSYSKTFVNKTQIFLHVPHSRILGDLSPCHQIGIPSMESPGGVNYCTV